MPLLEIAEGQEVVSSDGHLAGKIVTLTPETLIVEKGFFLPVDLACHRSDVAEVRGGKVLLSITRAQLEDRARAVGLAARGEPPGKELSAAGAQAMAEVTGSEIEGTEEGRQHPDDDGLAAPARGGEGGSASHP